MDILEQKITISKIKNTLALKQDGNVKKRVNFKRLLTEIIQSEVE